MGVLELVSAIDSELTTLREQVAVLENARTVLASNGSSGVSPGSPPSPPSPPASRGASNGRRRGRPRGGGSNRAEQAIRLVGERPGIRIPEMASAMGIQPNYLYRVLPKLSEEGKLKRDGQGWFPVS